MTKLVYRGIVAVCLRVVAEKVLDSSFSKHTDLVRNYLSGGYKKYVYETAYA